MDKEVLDVWRFQRKFRFPNNSIPGLLTRYHMEARIKFLREEINELEKAMQFDDLAGQVDALIDLTYVAKGTALRLGVGQAWGKHWTLVHNANMKKEFVASVDDPGHKGTIIKPLGWRSPDHSVLLVDRGYRPNVAVPEAKRYGDPSLLKE